MRRWPVDTASPSLYRCSHWMEDILARWDPARWQLTLDVFRPQICGRACTC